jgi:hypothetical protein
VAGRSPGALCAESRGLLSEFSKHPGRLRASFYADDAAIFLKPVKDEIQSLFQILDFFGQTSGLKINHSKCTFFPIRCDSFDMPELTYVHGCSLGTLPCTYLGLPLNFRNLRRVDYQVYIDKVASHGCDSQCGSMSVNPQEQEGKSITLSN